jgi:hypothetical protein
MNNDMVLFQGLARHKPIGIVTQSLTIIGIHRHFQWISLLQFYNRHAPITFNIDQLKAFLLQYYDPDVLEHIVTI